MSESMSAQDNLLGPRRALQVVVVERHQSRRGISAPPCARNPPLKECISLVAEASRAVVRLRKTRWWRAGVEAA